MKNKIIVLALMMVSTFVFGQKAKTLQLDNTYWKAIMHQGNSGTWTFDPLKEKPKPDADFKYLIFYNSNQFQAHTTSKDCKKNIQGTYSIENSKVNFVYSLDKSEEDCDYFRLKNRSVILKNNKLYLAKYSKWYDEKNIKNDTIILEKEQLGRSDRNDENKIFVYDANYILLDDGTYKLNEENNPGEKYIFTMKNGALDGKSITVAKNNKTEIIFNQGLITSEKKWISGTLFLEKYNTEEVKKEAGNYIITLKEVKNNYRSNDQDSTVTVFRNRKPIVKSFYQYGKLVSVKDFEKNTFQKFGSNNQVLDYEDSDKKINYDGDGKEKRKELYLSDAHELYEDGLLKMKKIYAKDTITTQLYDEKGKLTDTKTEARKDSLDYEIADPNKYASELSSEQFEYYKSVIK